MPLAPSSVSLTRLRNVLVITGLCALTLIPHLDRSVPSAKKELRVLLPARSMAEGGNWLIPEFMGQPRFRKPPLMYWIVASAFKAAHTTEKLAVARLPSVLAAAGLAVAVYLCGSAMVGRRSAFIGACCMVTSERFIRHARMASTEVVFVLFVVLAVLCAYAALVGRRRTMAWIGVGLVAGLGFMTKGPAAAAIPLAAITTFGLTSPAYRKKLLDWRVLLAAGLFALIAAPWYIFVAHHSRADAAAQAAIATELAETFQGTDHGGPIYYYLLQLPAALMPWGLLLPFALYVLWKHSRTRAGSRFVMGWLASGFVLLSLTPNKQPHYALLLIAPAALGLGCFLSFGFSKMLSWKRTLSRHYVNALLIVSACLGAALALAPFFSKHVSPVMAVLGFVVSAGIAGSMLMYAGSFRIRLGAAWVSVAFFLAVRAIVIDPLREEETMIPLFTEQSRKIIHDQARIFAVGEEAPLLEFYLHRPLLRTRDFSVAWKKAAPNDAVILCWKKHSVALTDVAPPDANLDMHRKDLHCRLYVRE